MRPTAQQVFELARKLLSDDVDGNFSTGQWATDAYLSPFLQTAYSDLFAAHDDFDGDRLLFSRYVIVEPNQAHLPLSAINRVSEFKSLDSVQSKQLGTGDAAAAASSSSVQGSDLRITSAAHGLTNGDEIVVLTVGTGAGDLEKYLDVWNVEVIDNDNFDLLGAGPAAILGTPASFSWIQAPNGSWGPPYHYLKLPKDLEPPGVMGPWYSRVGDEIRLGPTAARRLLQISFEAAGRLDETSGVIQSDTVIPFSDSLDFLAYATAVKGGAPKVGAAMSTLLDRYRTEAYGPDYPNEIGGHLGKVVDPEMRAQQQRVYRSSKFGRRVPANRRRRGVFL